MKKVIIPFDGAKFSEGAFSFAVHINKIRPVLLTGIFLSETDFSRFLLFPRASSDAALLLERKIQEENIQENIERFTSLCQKNNIEVKVHRDMDDFAFPELTKETRFADLLLIGSEMIFENVSNTDYNIFLRDTLQHTECPVMIVPENFYFPSMNILAYDGSTSSVFAIKQFAYLFPDLCDNKTILVYASEGIEDIPAEVNIEELAASHFSDLAITVLITGHGENLTDWVLKHENPLLISGSFGRSGLSSQLTKTFVSNIIDAHLIPVFIAHQ